ncbi:lysozyme inhibitor LprI family protein [Azospirillum picis]|uniref:Uncharacterized protein YecT (DUF1311 family) n=1 Tax=Azospirillum picis TaxID=488438 RepID=A0ABU0MG68_9PROT|nr:lysozyme inhibitor LprI family protein [Azospirillum picis]MBP2298513.1 uncharacterized protein YecT (DUF1311 family) [Azospirillum picis]MDQ0532438.1 uncharacterized protein YecT (DUF1311 family) [Azospirillum picis]
MRPVFPALSLLSGLLAAGSLVAFLAAGPVHAEQPPGAPAAAAGGDGVSGAVTAAPACGDAESPVAQLICREPALSAAAAAMKDALEALAATTDDTGRTAIEAAQTLWRSRRDEACPVVAADLGESKGAKVRGDCLLRMMKQRTTALTAERQARLRPLGDLPVTVSGAAAPRFPAPPAHPPVIDRKVTLSALAGRWAKAAPADRTVIDDCRSSYLEIGSDLTLHAADPRLPVFPLDGRLAADGDPLQAVSVLPPQGGSGAADRLPAEPQPESKSGPQPAGVPAPLGSLRLEPADSPRFDRLVLRIASPAGFAAEFVRCR